MAEASRNFLNRNSSALILAIFGLFGAILIWMSTPWGIGVGYDSIFYLSAADNLLSGLGLGRVDGYGNFIPLTHFPPLYPLSLAGLSFLAGIESDLAARILAALVYGILVWLIGWLIYLYTNSRMAGVLGAGLGLISPFMLDLSYLAMSEQIYLVLLLLLIHTLNRFVFNQKFWYLVVAGALAAMAYLTRYVGLSVIILGVIALLVFGRRPLRKKVKDTISFAVISLFPMLIFYFRNWLLTGSLTNRVILYHPPTASQLKLGISTIAGWLLPPRFGANTRAILLVLLVITMVILIIVGYLQKKDHVGLPPVQPASQQFIVLIVMYMAIYLLMLGVSLTFFDASTRLNDRILSPIYILGILLVFIVLWNSSYLQEKSWLRIGIVLGCIGFIVLNLLQGWGVANRMRLEGRGFSSKQWRSSATIEKVSDLPADTLIFSNEAFAIYYLAGRTANWLPENYDPVKGQKANDYDQQIDAMQAEILSRNGALVIFDSISKNNVYAPLEQMTSRLKLLVDLDDGSIFVKP